MNMPENLKKFEPTLEPFLQGRRDAEKGHKFTLPERETTSTLKEITFPLFEKKRTFGEDGLNQEITLHLITEKPLSPHQDLSKFEKKEQKPIEYLTNPDLISKTKEDNLKKYIIKDNKPKTFLRELDTLKQPEIDPLDSLEFQTPDAQYARGYIAIVHETLTQAGFPIGFKIFNQQRWLDNSKSSQIENIISTIEGSADFNLGISVSDKLRNPGNNMIAYLIEEIKSPAYQLGFAFAENHKGRIVADPEEVPTTEDELRVYGAAFSDENPTSLVKPQNKNYERARALIRPALRTMAKKKGWYEQRNKERNINTIFFAGPKLISVDAIDTHETYEAFQQGLNRKTPALTMSSEEEKRAYKLGIQVAETKTHETIFLDYLKEYCFRPKEVLNLEENLFKSHEKLFEKHKKPKE